jgi:hypothetical protein
MDFFGIKIRYLNDTTVNYSMVYHVNVDGSEKYIQDIEYVITKTVARTKSIKKSLE